MRSLSFSLSYISEPTWKRTSKMEMMRLFYQWVCLFSNHSSVSCRQPTDASSWSAWIKPPAARRPNQHVLTYESQGVYKTCVVCLVWLLSCLCSWPHTDQTNAGCTSLKRISGELGEGEVGWEWWRLGQGGVDPEGMWLSPRRSQSLQSFQFQSGCVA